MRYKGNLVLLEMMIALTFFAIAAVISTGVLANAFAVSRDSRDRTRAMFIAQQWAEDIAASGDPVALLESAAQRGADGYIIRQDGHLVTASVAREETGAGALYDILIEVSKGGEASVTLPASCYVPGGTAP
jgi:Tfp pilus assembly protein PilV